jgi:hypothetical protein
MNSSSSGVEADAIEQLHTETFNNRPGLPHRPPSGGQR